MWNYFQDYAFVFFLILWNCLQDDPDSEDEDKYADRADMPGQKFDTKRLVFTFLVHELNKHDTALILQLLNDEHMKLTICNTISITVCCCAI